MLIILSNNNNNNFTNSCNSYIIWHPDIGIQNTYIDTEKEQYLRSLG